jgi:hypothetical protein
MATKPQPAGPGGADRTGASGIEAQAEQKFKDYEQSLEHAPREQVEAHSIASLPDTGGNSNASWTCCGS